MRRPISWKAISLIVSSILLLVILNWVLRTPIVAHETGYVDSVRVVMVKVQVTPTVDPTMTSLEKEQLTQEINKLRNDNAWAWTNFATPFTILAGLVAAFFGGIRWFGERRMEQQKRSEERFQAAVAGLGNKDLDARVGAAIMLRTFLRTGYEQFYSQAFDLAVAHLRLRKADLTIPGHPSSPNQTPIIISGESPLQGQKQDDLKTSMLLDSLSQALITVFKESFPLARNWVQKQQSQTSSSFIRGIIAHLQSKKQFVQIDHQSLDASGIQLDNAYLAHTDLTGAWLPRASLREANLRGANLTGANLTDANLTGANLAGANLTNADLRQANLSGANLFDANLAGANLRRANLERTFLMRANLTKVVFKKANLTRADFTEGNLIRADFTDTHPEAAYSLKDAKMQCVIGLTQKQHDACMDKKAIFDVSD